MKGVIVLRFQTFLKFALVLAAGFLSLSLLFGCDGGRPQAQAESGVYSIDELLVNPNHFTDEIFATGTFTNFEDRNGVRFMGLVDNDHILICRNVECVGSKIYAVNTSGQANPQVGDVATLRGAFQQMGNAMIFVFTELRIDNNIAHTLTYGPDGPPVVPPATTQEEISSNAPEEIPADDSAEALNDAPTEELSE